MRTALFYRLAALCIITFTVTGCGSGTSGAGAPPPQNPSFTLSIFPSSITLNQQGSSQPVQIDLTGQGGFTGSVTVSAGTLPAGITIAPSTLTISAATPGTLNISASSAAQIAQQTIAFNGTSGTVSGKASVQVTVKGALVPDPFHHIGGTLVHGFYDESRQLLFATNLGLNELDVISGVDDSLKARIPVPLPLGIDQMADGKTLVVGTEAQELVTVDENTYAVTTHPVSAAGTGGINVVFPTVVAMANGKVFAIGQEQGVDSNDVVNGGQTLFEWNSNTDTFTQIEPPPLDLYLWETDRLARSGDHKWAVFSADQFYLYSSDSDSFTTAPLNQIDPSDSSISIRGYAMNADGSKIAVASADEVSFFDRSFTLLGKAQLPGAFQTARSAVQFSADGTRLYLQYAFPLSLVELDVASFSSPGYFSATVSPDDDNLEGLLATDAGGHGYFNIEGGVQVVNLLQTPIPNTTGSGFYATPCDGLGAIVPLNTTQQVQAPEPLTGISVYIGGQPATLDSTNSTVTIPASAVSGPQDVECITSLGVAAVVAQGVSYGVDPVALSANLLPPTGNVTANIYGFGFATAPSTGTPGTPPTVTVGNSPSSKVAAPTPNGLGAEQGTAIQIPSGTPGESVNVGVSSALGRGTLSAAAIYYPTPTILPASGILQLIFDTHRNRLYALKANEVDVLDGANLRWLAPLAFPAAFTGTVQSMGITPDGSKLAVLALTAGQPNMIVLDPAGGSPATVATYTGYGNFFTGSMGITNQNTAIITGSPILVFNLSTNTFTASSTTSPIPDVIRASADGTHIYGAQLNISSGSVHSIDPSTIAVSSESFGYLFWTDLAVSPDGSRFAAVDAPPFAAGDLVGFFNAALQYVNANAYPDYSLPDDTGVVGATYSPGGNVVVVALGDSIELWDANTGTLRDRLLTPEELHVLVYPENAVAPLIALNEAGDTIFAVSASGLSVIPLPGPMDQMVPMPWPENRPAGHQSAAMRGTPAMRMKAMVKGKGIKPRDPRSDITRDITN